MMTYKLALLPSEGEGGGGLLAATLPKGIVESVDHCLKGKDLGTQTLRRQSVPNRGACPHLRLFNAVVRAVSATVSWAACCARLSLKRWTTDNAVADGRKARLASRVTPCDRQHDFQG